MQFRAEQYYRVSAERMAQTIKIYQDGAAFALAMYCGGLAVESLLRAFRWTKDSNFEGRHDLSELLKGSGLLQLDEEWMRRSGASDAKITESGRNLRAAMNEVIALWHNNLRFASEASLKAFLRRIDRLQGVKGDPLKANARVLIESVQTVLYRGTSLWTSEIKS
jgi:acyl-coenzyme A thioesterase PaaI-like protein